MVDNANIFEQVMQGFAALTNIHHISYQYNSRQLVYQHDKVKLYHYHAKNKKIDSTPLLVVFSTVNRPEILDLFPEQSFVGELIRNGIDIYLLDWGYPDFNDKHLSLDHYINHYLYYCVQFIKEANKVEKINLLGVCLGGILSLCYASLHVDIKKLILISTPIDFHTSDNVVANIVNKLDVKELAAMTGNISGSWLTQFFISLRPFELMGKKYLRFVDNISNEETTKRFLQVEKWLHDTPDQAGVAFTEFTQDFYRENKLIKNQIYFQGKRIDLANLSIPILNVMAKADEIIPMSASKVLKKYINPIYYSQRVFSSGHIGIYLSDKVVKAMPKAISTWLKKV